MSSDARNPPNLALPTSPIRPKPEKEAPSHRTTAILGNINHANIVFDLNAMSSVSLQGYNNLDEVVSKVTESFNILQQTSSAHQKAATASLPERSSISVDVLLQREILSVLQRLRRHNHNLQTHLLDTDCEMLAPYATITNLSPGEYHVRAGERHYSAGFVVSGELSVETTQPLAFEKQAIELVRSKLKKLTKRTTNTNSSANSQAIGASNALSTLSTGAFAAAANSSSDPSALAPPSCPEDSPLVRRLHFGSVVGALSLFHGMRSRASYYARDQLVPDFSSYASPVETPLTQGKLTTNASQSGVQAEISMEDVPVDEEKRDGDAKTPIPESQTHTGKTTSAPTPSSGNSASDASPEYTSPNLLLFAVDALQSLAQLSPSVFERLMKAFAAEAEEEIAAEGKRRRVARATTGTGIRTGSNTGVDLYGNSVEGDNGLGSGLDDGWNWAIEEEEEDDQLAALAESPSEAANASIFASNEQLSLEQYASYALTVTPYQRNMNSGGMSNAGPGMGVLPSPSYSSAMNRGMGLLNSPSMANGRPGTRYGGSRLDHASSFPAQEFDSNLCYGEWRALKEYLISVRSGKEEVPVPACGVPVYIGENVVHYAQEVQKWLKDDPEVSHTSVLIFRRSDHLIPSCLESSSLSILYIP